MRAHEFVQDDYNPETVKPGFEKKRWYKGRYLMVAQAREPDKYEDRPARGLIIKVYDPSSKSMWFKSAGIAQARFIVIDRDHMEVSMVSVADEYQRQGIASAMYNFARELGNEVRPSSNRTAQGKAFWAAGAGAGRETPDEPPAPVAEPTVAATPTPAAKTGFFKRLFKTQ